MTAQTTQPHCCQVYSGPHGHYSETASIPDTIYHLRPSDKSTVTRGHGKLRASKRSSRLVSAHLPVSQHLYLLTQPLPVISGLLRVAITTLRQYDPELSSYNAIRPPSLVFT